MEGSFFRNYFLRHNREVHKMFFKVIGIYTVCVTIHEIGRVGGKVLEKCLDRVIDARAEERRSELKPKEVSPRDAHIVQNRIGF